MTDPQRPTRAGRRAADAAGPATPAPAQPDTPVADTGAAETGTGDAAPAEASVQDAAIASPTADVADAEDAPRLPGEHRGGFARLPTAPIDLTIEGAVTVDAPWVEPQRPSTGLAGWALAGGILGLTISFFVGWGFPVGLAGAIAAIVALNRPLESRPVAVWALVLSLLSIVYSAGWLLWAAYTASLIG